MANGSAAESLSEQGKAFLAENALRDDIQVTPSGLQYKILKPGTGDRPGKKDRVRVHYQGKHVNGEVFDGNFAGEPSVLKLSKVIKGWREGLQLIGEGGRILLITPPNLAYGRRGNPPLIGRNETLIFIVDLIEVQNSGRSKR